MNLVARGVPETFAVFLLPVQKGLGVSRADITLTYSVYMLAYGLSGPLVGQLIDRFGARLAYGFGLASLGLGYILAGFSTDAVALHDRGGAARRARRGSARHDRGLRTAQSLVHVPHRLDHIAALRGDRRRHAACCRR